MSDARLEQARQWLASIGHSDRLTPVAGDASFRRYFRLATPSGTAILMDSPSQREDISRFLDAAARLRAANLAAPALLAENAAQGYLLLEDLGEVLLRERLDERSADTLFPRLLDLLASMAGKVDGVGLPPYNRERLLTEMELFTDWYLERHRGIRLGCAELEAWEALCTLLIASAQEQPQVFVHRDFHSCNLLDAPDGRLGVIDFQDALQGPLTYDFISLAWDRYLPWPRTRLLGWMEQFRRQVAPDTPPDTWVRWCDFMGLQRNLKIVGIFARLHHRDHKRGYLEMIPRFWTYLQDVLPIYPETREFHRVLERLSCAP